MHKAIPAVFGVIASLAAAALPAFAHEGMVHEGCPTGQSFTAGDITVSGAFTRATLPDAPVGAGYLTISNAGSEADRLISATSLVTPTVELHTMSTENGVMKMERLPDGIEVPAGETVSLAPGGLHIMFIGPNQPFNEGECVEVVLDFEKAGELPVQLNVGPVGASEAPMAHEHN
jgi:copper(I)-binding protein